MVCYGVVRMDKRNGMKQIKLGKEWIKWNGTERSE
jgi:hypothetical protein